MDETRETRERILDYRDGREGNPRPSGDRSDRLVGRVINGGSMPTTVPAVFLVQLIEFDGGQREGDVPAVDATGDPFGVVFLGPDVPSVGDAFPIVPAGGRWVADMGAGADTQAKPNCTPMCTAVNLPYEVTISWPNVYGFIPDPFHHAAPTWGVIYPEASGTLTFNPGELPLGLAGVSPYWQGWVGTFDRTEGATTFHYTMEWFLGCSGGTMSLFLHTHTDAVVFPTSDIYYGFGGDFDVTWTLPAFTADPPSLPFIQVGALLGGNVLPNPTVSAPTTLGECCQVFSIATECGLALTAAMKIYDVAGGRLIQTATIAPGLGLVSWKGTCSVHVVVTADGYADFEHDYTFTGDDTTIVMAVVPGTACCQTFRVVSCFGLPIGENLFLTVTDRTTGAARASDFLGGDGILTLQWTGSCDVHVAISGGLAVRYLPYAADLPIATGGTTEIVLWPVDGYVCIAGCGSPVKTTLHMTHTVFGAVTLVYNATGIYGAGWYAFIAHAYPGRNCCPAKTIPVTCFLGVDGSYADHWRSA